MTHPLLFINFFDTTKFLKHRRVPVRSFLVLWVKKFSTENRDTPPLLHVIPRYQTFSDTQKGPLRSFSVLWDKNFSTENRDTPPLLHVIPRYQTFSDTQKGSRTNFFGTLRFSTENRYTPLPLIHIIFLNHTFCETQFSHGEIAKFRRKIIILLLPPLFLKWFVTRSFLKHRNVPLRKISFLRDKKIRSKFGTPPPLIHKIFRYQYVFETQMFPLRSSTVLWDNKLSTENHDTPSLVTSYPKKFSIRIVFLKHRRVSLRNFSVLWHRSFSTEIYNVYLFCTNILDPRNFLKHRLVLLWKNSVLWDKTFSTKNRDTPLPFYRIKFLDTSIFL